MARKLTPKERTRRRTEKVDLFSMVDEIATALYKGHVKRKGIEPDPIKRAALVDKFYLRACRAVGVEPIKKEEQ